MIGKTITTILTNSAPVTAIISDRLFAVNDYFRADEDNFPSIYYIVSLAPNYYKNGRGMNVWTVSLLTMCKTYAESWDLTMKAIKAIQETKQQTIDGYYIQNVECTKAADEYEFNSGGTYGQTIDFEIKTNEI